MDNKQNVNEEEIKANALRNMQGLESSTDPTGWIEHSSEKLSYAGKLYPEGYRFSIKPVNAGLMKYFSTIDESNAMSVQDALVYTIENHVRVLYNGKFIKSTDVVYEHDRMYMTLLVHQYSGAPTDLIVNAMTPSNVEQQVIIKPSSLVFSNISEKGWSYLNSKDGVFEIQTKSFGIVKYKPLTIKQSIDLTRFLFDKNKSGEEIEAFFIQAAPFFAAELPVDANPKDIYQLYFKKTQDMKYVSVLMEILKHVNAELKLEFNAVDEKTKEPFRTPVTSLKGFKNIFVISDSASELQ